MWGLLALWNACANGFESIVKLLLENGVKVNSCDPDNESALHATSARRHQNIVQILLEHGADALAQDETGDTAEP
jgi:ankyrin repeat protein